MFWADAREGVLDGIQATDKTAGARCRSGGGGSSRDQEGRSTAAGDEQAAADDQAPADDGQQQAQYAPPPADPADQIEHLAQLHASGALTDEEFTAAKAQALGS